MRIENEHAFAIWVVLLAVVVLLLTIAIPGRKSTQEKCARLFRVRISASDNN